MNKFFLLVLLFRIIKKCNIFNLKNTCHMCQGFFLNQSGVLFKTKYHYIWGGYETNYLSLLLWPWWSRPKFFFWVHVSLRQLKGWHLQKHLHIQRFQFNRR